MQHWLDKLTDLTAIEANQSNLEDALAGLTEQIGFRGYVYLNVQPGHVLAISNYHPDWQSRYFERNYSARAKSLKRIFTRAGEQETPRLPPTTCNDLIWPMPLEIDCSRMLRLPRGVIAARHLMNKRLTRCDVDDAATETEQQTPPS
ncbi:autoinducer binding domain-containing protein [Rhizobium rhizogenes]|uniref:autoinducer binding domain-containing protein n=1 Tax=Rhizobium rhizogenes TaxID=359 RepID=UPI001574C0FB|nr:autoinducer binding domain-containing protein [Rhizobium rhizogenes]NTF47082.1 hypothetical protein [Rhizobium rhizogenes]